MKYKLKLKLYKKSSVKEKGDKRTVSYKIEKYETNATQLEKNESIDFIKEQLEILMSESETFSFHSTKGTICFGKECQPEIRFCEVFEK